MFVFKQIALLTKSENDTILKHVFLHLFTIFRGQGGVFLGVICLFKKNNLRFCQQL